MVELDAKIIVQLLISNKNSNNAYSPLLNDYRFLLSQFQHFKVNHVYWEANRAADKLAKEGCTCPFDCVILDFPNSKELCNILCSNASGLYTLRHNATTLSVLSS